MTKPKRTQAGARVLVAAKQALAYLQGDKRGVRETIVWRVDVKAIREKLDLSQREFAETYGIPLGTLRSWEQGQRQPDAPATALLRTIARYPKQVKSALTT